MGRTLHPSLLHDPGRCAMGAATKIATRVLAATFVVVLISAGPALAVLPLIVGTNAPERISGTRNAEEIRALDGADEVTDGSGADHVYGGGGADNLVGSGGDASTDRFYGGGGNDTVQPRDVPAVKDVVGCGAGTDTVYADKADVVGGDCERVKAW